MRLVCKECNEVTRNKELKNKPCPKCKKGQLAEGRDFDWI